MKTDLIPAGLPIPASLDYADLETMERAAYQRGDVELASLLARVVEAEEATTEAVREADERADDAERALARMSSCVDDAMQRLELLIAEAPEGRITKAEFGRYLAETQGIRDALCAAYQSANS